MAPRNGVKKRIVRDVWSWISSTPQKRHGMVHKGRPTAVTVVSSGANSSSLRERSVITGTATDAATVVFAGADSSSLPERITTGTSVGVLRTGSPMTPAELAVVKSTGILSPSLAAGVDKSLDAGPPLTRSNPTASILVKVPSADSLKYEGSRLYKNEKGDWVADLMPENIAESDAPSRTKMMGDRIDWPTPTMV